MAESLHQFFMVAFLHLPYLCLGSQIGQTNPKKASNWFNPQPHPGVVIGGFVVMTMVF